MLLIEQKVEVVEQFQDEYTDKAVVNAERYGGAVRQFKKQPISTRERSVDKDIELFQQHGANAHNAAMPMKRRAG